MSAGSLIWLRIAIGSALAIVLLLAVSPAQPASRLTWPAQPAVGVCAGGLLFLLATRRRPHLPTSTVSLPLLVARHGFLGLWAANEEIVWRRVMLGELLPGGVVPALAASTIGFALAHRARRGLHIGTGATFGSLYLATGALATCVAAHWTYNLFVGGLVDRARIRSSPDPRGAR